MIKAYLYSYDGKDYANDKWDYGLLKEIFDKYEIDQVKVTSIPKVDKGFVIVPGPQSLGHEEAINKEIQNISRVLLFITGDEEGKFDITKINHPNIEVWIQYPHEKHKDYNKLPIGVPQHLNKSITKYHPKDIDVYFSGQVTHSRRRQLAEVMQSMSEAVFKPTGGFAQGDIPKDYYKELSSARIAPAPSGAIVIDSFRFFEAIEMLCLPVADKIDSKGNYIEFYKNVFGYDLPIVHVSNWSELSSLVPKLLKDYPNNMHQIVAWWIKYKRDLGIKIMGQINA
jgi:hypothetical protein